MSEENNKSVKKTKGRPKRTQEYYEKLPSISYELPPDSKDMKIIIVGGFRFYRKGKNDNRYRCGQKGCKSVASVQLLDDGSIKVYRVTPHNHTHTQERIEKKARALEMNEQTLMSNSEIIPNENAMVLAREKHATAVQMGTPKEFGELITIEVYPLVLSYCHSTIVFGQVSSLFIMSKSKYIFVDGTFKIVSDYMGQMFVMHCLYEGLCMSTIFVKMDGKEKEEYKRAIKMIYEMGLQVGVKVFNENTIIKCDYEQSIILAFEELFPSIRISGCLFHYKKAINTYCGKLDLKGNCTHFNKLKQQMLNLPLLPIEYINENTIGIMMNECKSKYRSEENKNQIDMFEKYMKDTWLCEESTFPPKIWNVSDNYQRTNNYSESANSFILRKCDGKVTISVVMESIIRTMQSDKCKLMRSETSGKKLTELKNESLTTIMNFLTDNKIDFKVYLTLVGGILNCNNNEEIRVYKTKWLNDGKIAEYNNSSTLVEQRRGTLTMGQYLAHQTVVPFITNDSELKIRENDNEYVFKQVSEEVKRFGEHISLNGRYTKEDIFKYDEDIEHFMTFYLNNESNPERIRAARTNQLITAVHRTDEEIESLTKKIEEYKKTLKEKKERRKKLVETIKKIRTPFNEGVDEVISNQRMEEEQEEQEMEQEVEESRDPDNNQHEEREFEDEEEQRMEEEAQELEEQQTVNNNNNEVRVITDDDE